jgi:hypothetical protein
MVHNKILRSAGPRRLPQPSPTRLGLLTSLLGARFRRRRCFRGLRGRGDLPLHHAHGSWLSPFQNLLRHNQHPRNRAAERSLTSYPPTVVASVDSRPLAGEWGSVASWRVAEQAALDPFPALLPLPSPSHKTSLHFCFPRLSETPLRVSCDGGFFSPPCGVVTIFATRGGGRTPNCQFFFLPMIASV